MLKTRFGFSRADTLKASPVLQLCLIATLALGVGLFGHSETRLGTDAEISAALKAPALQQALQDVAQSPAVQGLSAVQSNVSSVLRPTLAAKLERATREVELDEGQTFADMLQDSDVSDADAAAAMNALSKIYDLRKLQAGQAFTLSFLRNDNQDIFTGATFQPEATREMVVARAADGSFAAEVKMIPVERHRLAARGEINSSLYEAGDRANVPHAIMAALIRIYSHDVDFQRDIHPGDSFEVLYDQPMTAQGKAVGEGSIIYAAIHVGDKIKPIYRVIFSDNSTDYFDDRGQSIRRALLRTPVAAAHITSGFGMRVHPLLGYSKMHKGIDFGAPIGTPIFAAGGGTIEDIGFKNGYGRYIRIRHNGTINTAYAHMSRFGANMYRGAHVNQGEVIGYVGMSGRATVPHLHFEVIVNNQQVNPMSINLPSGRNLEGKLLADFRKGEGQIKQQFDSLIERSLQTNNQPANAVLVKASATTPAYGPRSTTSCGLRAGC